MTTNPGGQEEPLSEAVSRNVRALRARKRWRQEDLAEATGWARSTVSAVEANSRRVTLEDALVLCRVLGADIYELTRGASVQDLQALGLVRRE